MSTSPKIAALAVDLGVKLGSDLVPRKRRESLPWTASQGACAIQPSTVLDPIEQSSAPLEPSETTDDTLEFAPTSRDWRNAQKRMGIVAVYIAGPQTAVPTVLQGMELWPICVGVTANPRNLKAVAQFWNWHTIALHALLWAPDRAKAEALKERLVNALDYRRYELSGRWYNVAPAECLKLANEVAAAARIPVFDEAERWRRLEAAVGAGVKRIGRR